MLSLKHPRLFFVVPCSLVLSFAASAQTTTTASPNQPSTSPSNPTMTSGYNDNDKEAVYARFNDYKRNPDPNQQQYAYPAAKAYLLRWGGENDSETKEVRRFVIEYERAMHGRQMHDAYDAKDYAKVFEIGRPAVKSDAENFQGFSLMVEAAYDNAMAGKSGFVAEATDYARNAIKLLESGKVTKPEPFKNMEIARGYLNFVLGWFVKDEKPAEAAAAFMKAVKPDSPFHTDPSAYHRLGIAILKGEFAQLSTEYNQKFGGQQSSPEQTAMLNRIQHLVEQTIDAYARAVALSTKPEQKEARDKILAQLTALYKNFHNNSDAGLEELISTVLSKPMP